jgi:hypothetical protein
VFITPKFYIQTLVRYAYSLRKIDADNVFVDAHGSKKYLSKTKRVQGRLWASCRVPRWRQITPGGHVMIAGSGILDHVWITTWHRKKS